MSTLQFAPDDAATSTTRSYARPFQTWPCSQNTANPKLWNPQLAVKLNQLLMFTFTRLFTTPTDQLDCRWRRKLPRLSLQAPGYLSTRGYQLSPSEGSNPPSGHKLQKGPEPCGPCTPYIVDPRGARTMGNFFLKSFWDFAKFSRP